jgi:hypothetical protein
VSTVAQAETRQTSRDEHLARARKPGAATSAIGNVETSRNRVVRRADWRYLLPDPTPAKGVCFTSGLLALALKHVAQLTASADDIAGEHVTWPSP